MLTPWEAEEARRMSEPAPYERDWRLHDGPIRGQRRDEVEPDPDPSRPEPGLDTRLWDHDPASLFANVYRLGPRARFSWDRLIARLDPDLLEDLKAARLARAAV